MRILKYVMLLLLLSLIAVVVYIATQKGDFVVERSKIIAVPNSTVFTYISDVKNHSEFESWAIEDSSLRFSYGAQTVGKGASFTWEGSDSEGSAKINGVELNKVVQEKLDLDGSHFSINWKLKDTLNGKTKITWKAVGKMNFLYKFYTALYGGPDNVIGVMAEKSLANLDKKLTLDSSTYQIKVVGKIHFPEMFYIKQTFTSELKKVHRNAAVVIPKLLEFSKTNQLHINAKPFIIYHTFDAKRGLAKISVCLPIAKEIMTSAGSDILSGKINVFEGVKTSLTGSYVFLNLAMEQSDLFLKKENITKDPTWSHLEELEVSALDQGDQSKLQTNIIFPVKVQAAAEVSVSVENHTPSSSEESETAPKREAVKRVDAPAIKKSQEEVESEFEL